MEISLNPAFVQKFLLIAVYLTLGQWARADLLLFYDFDDASDPTFVLDTGDDGNDAEIFGAEYTEPGGGRTGGDTDRALDFMGDQDNVYIDVLSAMDGAFESIVENDAATITMWLFGGESQPQNNFVFWFADGDTDPRQLGAHVPWGNGNIFLDVAGCCDANQRLTANEPDSTLWKGQWNHYAFVKDEEMTRIYQNGELWLDSGFNPKDPLGPITTVRFGSGQAPGQWSYNGLMDDIGVWDEALTDDEIQEIMEDGLGVEAPTGPLFRRGDANGDGQINLSDPVSALSHLFAGGGGAPLTCIKSADTNDDGQVNLTDPVFHLNHLFASGPAPSPPGETCGSDPTPDDLTCSVDAGCQ